MINPADAERELTGAFLNFAVFRHDHRQTLTAEQLCTAGEGNGLVRDHIIEITAALHQTVAHDNAVFEACALGDAGAGEDDAVFYTAFNNAVVRYKTVAGTGTFPIVRADTF